MARPDEFLVYVNHKKWKLLYKSELVLFFFKQKDLPNDLEVGINKKEKKTQNTKHKTQNTQKKRDNPSTRTNMKNT